MVVVSGRGSLVVRNLNVVVLKPNQHPSASQSPFGVQVEALDADKAVLVDQPTPLDLLEEVVQLIRIDKATAHPLQDGVRGGTTILARLMRAVW